MSAVSKAVINCVRLFRAEATITINAPGPGEEQGWALRDGLQQEYAELSGKVRMVFTLYRQQSRAWA